MTHYNSIRTDYDWHYAKFWLIDVYGSTFLLYVKLN